MPAKHINTRKGVKQKDSTKSLGSEDILRSSGMMVQSMHIQQYYGHFSFDERFKKGGKGKYSKVQPRVEEILRSGGSVVLA